MFTTIAHSLRHNSKLASWEGGVQQIEISGVSGPRTPHSVAGRERRRNWKERMLFSSPRNGQLWQLRDGRSGMCYGSSSSSSTNSSSALGQHRVSRFDSIILQLTRITKGPVSEIRWAAGAQLIIDVIFVCGCSTITHCMQY